MPRLIEFLNEGNGLSELHPSRWQEKFQRVPAFDEEMTDANLQRNIIKLTGGRLDEEE